MAAAARMAQGRIGRGPAPHPVRVERWRRNLTQEQLAERAGLSTRTIKRAESGAALDAYSRERLAAALNLPSDDLGLRVARQPGHTPWIVEGEDGAEHDVNRQQFLALGGGALLGSFGALLGRTPLDVERVAAVAGGRERAHDSMLDDLLGVTHSYARQRGSVAPMALTPVVRGHLGLVEQLLTSAHPAGAASGLRGVASETATLAGWLSYLSQNLGDAAALYAAAVRLAREARDGPRLALALGSWSWTYSAVPRGGRGGAQPKALTLLQEATQATGANGPAPLRGWLWARRAEEHAIVGDATATDRALEASEDAVSAIRTPGSGLLSGVSEPWLAGYRGSCAVLLGRPATAVAALEGALRGNLADRGQRSAVATDLAVAHADQGDVERACALLGEVLETASAGDWRDQVQRVVGARRRLTAWDTVAAVRQLDEQLQPYLLPT